MSSDYRQPSDFCQDWNISYYKKDFANDEANWKETIDKNHIEGSAIIEKTINEFVK